MNWRSLRTIAFAGIASLAVGSTLSSAMAADRYTIGTNPQGSIYFTIGGGIAAALQNKLNKQVTVQPFTGSSVYLPLIDAGEVTLGLNSSLDLAGARKGDNGEPMPNLRVLARIWPLRAALAVRNDLGIKNVSELTGKRVVTTFSALKAMSTLSEAVLELSGLSGSDVEKVAVAGLGPGMASLTENALDATLIAVGIPLTQQAHATIPGGIRYLNIDGPGATQENADAKMSGLYLTEVKPSPRLPEVTEPVTVVAWDVFLTVDGDLPDEDATAILEALYDSVDQLKKDYPPLGAASQDKLSLSSNTVPFHPAAVEFYKSRNMWTDANTARDAGL